MKLKVEWFLDREGYDCSGKKVIHPVEVVDLISHIAAGERYARLFWEGGLIFYKGNLDIVDEILNGKGFEEGEPVLDGLSLRNRDIVIRGSCGQSEFYKNGKEVLDVGAFDYGFRWISCPRRARLSIEGTAVFRELIASSNAGVDEVLLSLEDVRGNSLGRGLKLSTCHGFYHIPRKR